MERQLAEAEVQAQTAAQYSSEVSGWMEGGWAGGWVASAPTHSANASARHARLPVWPRPPALSLHSPMLSALPPQAARLERERVVTEQAVAAEVRCLCVPA